jgi:hypothetical protein
MLASSLINHPKRVSKNHPKVGDRFKFKYHPKMKHPKFDACFKVNKTFKNGWH